MSASIEVTVQERGEDFMGSTFERTFTVAVPVAKAWAAFTEPAEREAWTGTRPPQLEVGERKNGASENHRLLSWSDSPAGLEGWHDTTVTFEEVGSGTRITIVRSGFGDSEDWQHFAESTNRGWDEMIADLIVYLETGVPGARHFSFRAGIGATTQESPAGLRVTYVVPGGFAHLAGMQSGDLILWLNGGPVFSQREVAFCVREHAPGDEIDVRYLRGREILSGSAPLSVWHFGGGEYVGHPGGFPKPALTGK
jgi:uncharacterized protein YndB with AHSA1/START domain